MKHTHFVLVNRGAVATQSCAMALAALLLSACTSQQAFEGLKAGHRATCLEYPESEFRDCVDETNTSYEGYRRQREEVIGN